MAKKFKVLKETEYGTFTEKAENGQITNSDVRRYKVGDSIELDPKHVGDMIANGIIEDPDAPKDEKKDGK